MAYLEWTDNLSVDVQELDDQHKKLIGLINELHEAIKAGKGKTAVSAALEGMITYALTHFAAEERYMFLHNFPGYKQHKLEHDVFVDTVADFQKKYREGNPVLSLEIMEFLNTWLLNHIQGVDKQYGPFLNTKGVH